MDDMISRQAAIERATKEHDFFRGAVTVSDKARRDELLNVMCWLGELPPAQPEIIHCEECVFYEAEDGWCEMHSGYGFWEKAFCSFAKRREVTT